MKTYEEHGKYEQGWKTLKQYEVDGKLLKMVQDMVTAERGWQHEDAENDEEL